MVPALAACGTMSQVTSGDGPTITQAQLEAYDGPKARIAVGPIVDKSGMGDKSVEVGLAEIQQASGRNDNLTVSNLTSGIRSLLTTALFNSKRFIVLERENIKDILVEQDFSQSGKVGQATKIPTGNIEGAELLVVGALTGFKPGALGGGGIPIPFYYNRDNGDFAYLTLNFKSSYVSMDLRVIDVRTSRVVATVATEGSATKTSASLGGFFHFKHGFAHLPNMMRAFANTPVEKAIERMVASATVELIKKTPKEYKRFTDTKKPKAPKTAQPKKPKTKSPKTTK